MVLWETDSAALHSTFSWMKPHHPAQKAPLCLFYQVHHGPETICYVFLLGPATFCELVDIYVRLRPTHLPCQRQQIAGWDGPNPVTMLTSARATAIDIGISKTAEASSRRTE
jgi:hypothetical protein